MDGQDNTRPTPAGSPFHEAVFANTATGPSSVMLVTIPEFSADLPFGDPDGVIWSPIGGALPQAGDRALVAESTDGSWWVVTWWSDTQTDSSSETLQIPTLTNSWVDFDVNRSARYYKHDGRVYLSGIVKNGTVALPAFTLPSGYWPASAGTLLFPAASNDLFGIVTVTTAGAVTPAIGSNAYFSLDGINFRHA